MKNKLMKLLTLLLSILTIVCFVFACTPDSGNIDGSSGNGEQNQVIDDGKENDGKEDNGEENNGTETPEHTHAYVIKFDNNNHWEECECGDKKNSTAHSGGTATCEEKAICKDCHTEYGSALGHNYGEWISNGNNQHIKTCANDSSHVITENCSGGKATCLAKAICVTCEQEYGELGDHSGGAATCEGKATCENCHTEYGSALGHNYGEWVSNGNNQHVKTCANDSSHVVTENCSGGTATCKQKAKCIICEWEYGDIGTHNYVNGRCECLEYEPTYYTDGLIFSHDGQRWKVCSYNGNATEVVIPSTYEDEPVTSIGNSAFRNCSSLTSIIIPSSVTSIGNSVFENCSSLTSIIVGGNNEYYKSIDGNLYSKDGETLIQYAIGKKTTTFVIPNSVTSIGDYAFEYCDSLTSIEIPNSVTSIGVKAFYDCDSLQYNTACNFKYLGNSSNPYLYLADTTNTSITTAIIDNNCKLIGYYAFYGCWSLRSIEIPNSVTSIGDSAFYDCSSLTSVTMGNNVTSIGNSAFRGCDSLTSIEIPNSVTSIGNSAFEDCNSLASIVIGEKVESIGSYAFEDCWSLRSIEIPNSVTNIDNFAFYRCSSLTSITIPFIGKSTTATEGYEKVFGYIFGYGKSNSSTAISGATYQFCDDWSTSYYKYYHYYIPTSLKTVVITGGESIGYSVFYNCSSLTRVVIGNSVTSIGFSAFKDCRSLTSVEIPNSVTSIDKYAFYNCDSLTSIEIPNSVTSIGEHAFGGCRSLISMTIPFVGAMLNGTWNTHFGYIFGASNYSNNRVYVPTSLKSLILTGGGITNYAFKDCSSLTSVTMGNNVTYVGSYAFSGCYNLERIEIPNSVIRIEEYAFYDCSSLTSMTIPFIGRTLNGTSNTHFGYIFGASNYSNNRANVPTSLKSLILTGGKITNYAFYDCSSLTSITIGNKVTSIGDYSFEGCDSLTKVYYVGNAEDWTGITIGNYNSPLTSATLYYYVENESDLPSDDGNYWHYVDGVPTVWEK